MCSEICFFLILKRHVGQQLVLRVGMCGEVVP